MRSLFFLFALPFAMASSMLNAAEVNPSPPKLILCEPDCVVTEQPSVQLTAVRWNKPTIYSNGDPLPAGIITGYKIYNKSGGIYSLQETINDPEIVTAYLPDGTYAIAALWTDNDYSSQTILSSGIRIPAESLYTGKIYTVQSTDSRAAIQATINSLTAGDILYFRGGTYHFTDDTDVFTIAVSGKSESPILITQYPGEKAIIQGAGYTDNVSPVGNQVLIRTTGDYIHIKDMEITKSNSHGLLINGNYNLAERINSHDNYESGIGIAYFTNKTITGSVIRYSMAHHNRHRGGIEFGPSASATSSDYITDCTLEYNLSFLNGYDSTDKIVTSPTDGGNSDGFGFLKYTHDNTVFPDNLGRNNTVRKNISWKNADDGFDESMGDGTLFIGNIAFDNGPAGNMGFKQLSYASGVKKYLGNVGFSNDSRGFDLRSYDGLQFVNNTGLNNVTKGASVAATTDVTNGNTFANSITHENGQNDTIGTYVTSVTNYLNTETNAPDLSDSALVATDINTTYQTGWTTQEYLEYIYNQIRQALIPTESGTHIGAGTNITGIHHSNAADDPSSPSDPDDQSLFSWCANQVKSSVDAVDQGAFEYMRIDPPKLEI